jgi:mannose-6-phosphate isomerase-like protein (cupin superfamily)
LKDICLSVVLEGQVHGYWLLTLRKEPMKNGYIVNIEKETIENTDYRRVLYTGENSQLVVMNLEPGVEIGEEVHELDQFIRVEEGKGTVILNGTDTHELADDWAVVIPAGVKHNVVNTGDVPLKLYSIYSPAEHKDGTIHRTKADEKEEHFDGVTTE